MSDLKTKLMEYIKTNDTKAIIKLRSEYVNNNEYAKIYMKAYKQAVLSVNSTDYKFVDLNTKVFIDTAE